MNTELKAIIDELINLEHVVADVAGKKDLVGVTVPDLIAAGMKMPSVISNWAGLKDEIAALSQQANQEDLEAYVLSKVVGGTPKAQAIIKAAVAMVMDAEQLYVAVKMQ